MAFEAATWRAAPENVAGGLAGGNAATEAGAAGSFPEMERDIEKRQQAAALSELERSSSSELEAGAPSDEEPRLEDELAKLPAWRSTITVRAIFIGGILGAAFSIISLKLGLTSGVIPSLNIAAGLLGFFFLGSLSKGLALLRIGGSPLTPQEVTVIQTCTVACYGMAFNGGFGTYVIAMDYQSYENLGGISGNRPQDVIQPSLGKLMAYMAGIALFGIFMLVPLRRQMIIKYNLPYPSGTATGLMINSFFATTGAAAVRRQLRSMAKWFSFSFLFSFFKWFFTGAGDCGTATGGFAAFPTFGLQALDWTWNFDFSQNYIGVGMICPQIVSWSVLFGSIISWGLMWPLISKREGDWYPADLPSSDFRGLYGYEVFISIFIFVTDGVYICCKLIILALVNVRKRRQAQRTLQARMEELEVRTPAGIPVPPQRSHQLPGTEAISKEDTVNDKDSSSDDEGDDGGHKLMAGETPFQRSLRRHVFMAGAIPWWVGVAGYAGMLAVAVGVIPQLYPPAKWYYVLVAGLLAPPLAFANAYGAGLTDWNMASLYGKLAIFIFAAWAGVSSGGVIAGLAVCGVVFASTSSASDLMQDFRTGYLTLSSPRAMFVAQLIGAVMGCVLAPLCFWLFWTAFPLGVAGTQYPAPYGAVYRGMAIVGVEGFGVLPKNCLALCGGFIGITIALNLARDFLPAKYGRFVPLPMAMALPFYLGAWLGIDMGIGAAIMLVWRYTNAADCQLLSAAVASGLIAGDGIWTIPSAILAMANVSPPICMGWSKNGWTGSA